LVEECKVDATTAFEVVVLLWLAQVVTSSGVGRVYFANIPAHAKDAVDFCVLVPVLVLVLFGVAHWFEYLSRRYAVVSFCYAGDYGGFLWQLA
jgi:hypothetical protein